MKNFLILSKISFVLGFMVFLSACSDDGSESTNSITFNFTVKADDENLIFGTEKYHTQASQAVTFESLQFYLSNIQIKDERTDTYYFEPESYHLISFNENHSTVFFTVENVPADFEISEIKMAIGVDAEANTSIDHIGDLDPTNGMAWDWNTGYKFLSLEGRYFAEDDPLGQEIKMHIGTDKNYFPISLPFDEPMKIVGNFNLGYAVDAMALFSDIDLAEGTVFMNDERGDLIAQNYSNQFLLIEESFGFVK